MQQLRKINEKKNLMFSFLNPKPPDRIRVKPQVKGRGNGARERISQ
jgi:hypothetical protein